MPSRFGVYDILELLGKYPVAEWSALNEEQKAGFVADCHRIVGARTQAFEATPSHLIDMVVAAYNADTSMADLWAAILPTLPFSGMAAVRQDQFRAFARALAVEPMQRLVSRLTLAAALEQGAFLQTVATGPVCCEMEQKPHLFVRGRKASAFDVQPAAFCSAIACHCEWQLVEPPAFLRRALARKYGPSSS